MGGGVFDSGRFYPFGGYTWWWRFRLLWWRLEGVQVAESIGERKSWGGGERLDLLAQGRRAAEMEDALDRIFCLFEASEG